MNLFKQFPIEVINYNKNFPYIIVDNFYDKNELDLIWKELDFFLDFDGDKLDDPDVTGSAKLDGKIIKKNKGFFLDEFYGSKAYQVSNILRCSRKLYNNWERIVGKNPNWYFKMLTASKSYLNHDTTLVSYYEDTDYYESHTDNSILTIVTWFYREPKGFDGGDFILNAKKAMGKEDKLKKHPLNEYEPQTIEIKNNRMVIFPSQIPHQVIPIQMKDKNKKRMGRYCLTNFLKNVFV